MSNTPDKSRLEQARERLESEASERLEAATELRSRTPPLEGTAKRVLRFEVDACDLRLVLDALRDARRQAFDEALKLYTEEPSRAETEPGEYWQGCADEGNGGFEAELLALAAKEQA